MLIEVGSIDHLQSNVITEKNTTSAIINWEFSVVVEHPRIVLEVFYPHLVQLQWFLGKVSTCGSSTSCLPPVHQLQKYSNLLVC